jgi:hypothetical protein
VRPLFLFFDWQEQKNDRNLLSRVTKFLKVTLEKGSHCFERFLFYFSLFFLKNDKMFLKNFLFFTLLLLVCSQVSFVRAEEETSCEYQGEIDECIEANKNGTALEIEDFVCLQTSDREEMVYNIILDKKFKEVDEKAEEEVENIEENCDEWF